MQRHLVVQIGLSGDRGVDLLVWPWFLILDVALEFQKLLSPEFDDVGVQFAYFNRRLDEDCTVESCRLTDGAEIRAIMRKSWKVKLHASTPSLAYPKCRECACAGCEIGIVMGWHFDVNLNAFKPAFNRGGKTPFKDVIACLSHVDWDLEHNEGRMPANDVLLLAWCCQHEWFWNCRRCNRVCLVATEHCTPVDEMIDDHVLFHHPWVEAEDKTLFCGCCALSLREFHDSGNVSDCMPHAQIPFIVRQICPTQT
jgi:hypothetical protein